MTKLFAQRILTFELQYQQSSYISVLQFIYVRSSVGYMSCAIIALSKRRFISIQVTLIHINVKSQCDSTTVKNVGVNKQIEVDSCDVIFYRLLLKCHKC